MTNSITEQNLNSQEQHIKPRSCQASAAYTTRLECISVPHYEERNEGIK